VKSVRNYLFILIAVVALATIALIVVVYMSGKDPLLDFLSPQPAEVQVYVQSPPNVEAGEEFSMIVTVQNDGNDYVQVDEIRIPESLLQLAVVKNVFPGSMEQEFYGDEAGFKIGYLVEPDSRKEFEISMMPWQHGDISDFLSVVLDEEVIKATFRLEILPAVAIVPTDSPIPSATASPTITPIPPSLTPTPVTIPFSAVVRLTAKIKYSSYFRDAWGGSGTIISPDGLILTNAHLIDPGPQFEADAFVIGLSLDPSAPPIDRYYAEPVIIDKDLDIAVLRISSDIRFKKVNPQDLNLPYVPLGDSDSLQLGDSLTILGYPNIGGDTITLTRGDVGGFTSQRKFGERAWIKTSASISGGTSGGLAMDEDGYLVAIPTQLGYGGKEDVVDCRIVTDTNLDGRINQNDMCIPTGGFINALRPIKLALPLIDAAKIALLTTLTPSPTP